MKVTIKNNELQKLLKKIQLRKRKLLKAEALHKLKKVKKHEHKLLELLLESRKLKDLCC
jgi:hypothetical protein